MSADRLAGERTRSDGAERQGPEARGGIPRSGRDRVRHAAGAGGIRRGGARPAHSGVRMQVIDRGQAYGILIRTPNERWVVIDAATNGEQADAMATEWNVDRVALADISHRHGDNLGGMDDIIDDFPVDRLLMNMADCPDGVGDDRVREAEARSNVVTPMAGSDAIEIGCDSSSCRPTRKPTDAPTKRTTTRSWCLP